MSKPMTCEKCGGPVIMVEYGYGSSHRYDGISEYACAKLFADKGTKGQVPECDWRVGRWCGQVLEASEVEPVFCKGKGHPRSFNLKD